MWWSMQYRISLDHSLLHRYTYSYIKFHSSLVKFMRIKSKGTKQTSPTNLVLAYDVARV